MERALCNQVGFSVSLSRPLYDLRKKMVRKLLDLAWHVRRVHTIKTILSDLPPLSGEDQREMTLTEFLTSVPAAELADTSELEAQDMDWVERINTDMTLQNAALMILEFYKTSRMSALEKSVQAARLYQEKLPHWNLNKWACLCVIMACDQFELLNPDMTQLTAEQIWDRALNICQEIHNYRSTPTLSRPDLSRVNRTRVFRDLGINLSFLKGLEKVKRRKFFRIW